MLFNEWFLSSPRQYIYIVLFSGMLIQWFIGIPSFRDFADVLINLLEKLFRKVRS
jgi:hypothetical protein